MSIEVDNRVIDESVYNIILNVQNQLTNGKLQQVYLSGDDVKVTCPFHSNGHENRPSCYVRLSDGVFHCFTCGSVGGLGRFVGECFDQSESWGNLWLITNYASNYIKKDICLKPLVSEQIDEYLDESILDKFENFHPYMKQRKLTDEVINRFDIKYDRNTKSIVFPVRDRYDRLVALTRRSVESKKFDIQKGFSKKNVYLLNEIIKNNIKTVYVCESQINSLTLWGWNYPSIALFGCGTTKEQIDELNLSGIKHYILCYDNDPAGRKGAEKFKRLINKYCFVDDIIMPVGKDVNDLTKEEFDNLISLQIKNNIL